LPDRRRRGYHSSVRALGVDVGGRRIGLAISDASGVLARPLEVIEARGRDQVVRVAEAIARAAAEEDGLRLVVVGLPRRLDGTPNEQTAAVTAFVEALRARIPQPVVLQDERLSSVEAESRLALRDRDWRSRKKKLDAAAAAVILQDYLDEAGQKVEDRR
jgi:putative holliday junction resolvase